MFAHLFYYERSPHLAHTNYVNKKNNSYPETSGAETLFVLYKYGTHNARIILKVELFSF